MAKTYTAAEVREIVGVLLGREDGVTDGLDFTSDAAREFLQTDVGDLRFWGAFKEVFAFVYDPDTLEVSAVERTQDFVGDPRAGLVAALKDRHHGLSLEIWGERHPWAAWCGDRTSGPEHLESFGRRPAEADDILKVVKAARNFEEPAIVYRR